MRRDQVPECFGVNAIVARKVQPFETLQLIKLLQSDTAEPPAPFEIERGEIVE